MLQVRLKPSDVIVLRDLLFDAFPDPERFTEFLAFRMNLKFSSYHGMTDAYPAAIRKFVTQINGEVLWRDLLREARNAVPNDPGLLEFAQRYEQAPVAVVGTKQGQVQTLSARDLELKVKAANPTLDIGTFRRRLGEIEGRVCRVEFPPKTPRGTGFLVGSDVVITNYHVVEKVDKGEIDPSQIVLRFDYKVLSNGVSVSEGKTYRLADEWLVLASPYSPLDLETNPQSVPSPDHLDFALLRVEGTPAADPVGGDTDDPSPVSRGWIAAQTFDHEFAKGSPLFVIQHPEGKPMQVALDSDAVLGQNSNGTRVRYTTNTEPGSSGSPCFDPNWDWIALPHSGDPNYYKLKTLPEYNEGIPLAAIIRYLKELGRSEIIGEGA